SARCATSASRQEQGTFVGHYRNGRMEMFTACRPMDGSRDGTREAIVVIEAPGFIPKRLDDTARYFARFEGTLRGPGAYGTANYYLRVVRVLELRAVAANDCG